MRRLLALARALQVGVCVLLDGGAAPALLVLREHVACVDDLLGRSVLLGRNRFLKKREERETPTGKRERASDKNGEKREETLAHLATLLSGLKRLGDLYGGGRLARGESGLLQSVKNTNSEARTRYFFLRTRECTHTHARVGTWP